MDARRVLRQRRQPDPVLCRVRARPECDRRLWRTGIARPCRPVRHRRLYHSLYAGPRIQPHHGRHHRSCSRHGVDGHFRGSVAARDRHRLHHDHTGGRPDHLGPGLSLDQHHRRRQRHQHARTARAVRHIAEFALCLLLCDPGDIRDRLPGDDGVRAFAARRRVDGHAGSAAPHECARLPRLADPVLRLSVLRPADLGVRHSVRLL